MVNGSSVLLFFGGVGALVALVSLVVVQTEGWQKKAFLTFANRVTLWVSDEVISAAVTRRLRRSAMGAAIGALIGIVAVALIVVVGPTIPFRSTVYLVAFPVLFIAVSVIPVTLALRDELYVHADDSPRIARTSHVEVRDYVSPGRFWAPPAFGAAATVLVALGVGLSASGQIDGPRFFGSAAVPWTAVVIVVLALGWAAARKIVRGNQTATDGLELAWSDAMRADALRNLWVLGTAIAWFAVVVAGLGLLGALEAPIEPSWAAIILQTSATWGAIVISRIYSTGGAYSYFRYRLWPDLGDVGEIVDESSEDADDAEIEERRS